MTHESPTPPRPMTATVDPAGTSAVLSTAPTPVETPQPISAATSGGTPSGIGTTALAGHDLVPCSSSRSRDRRGPAIRPAGMRRVVPSAWAWRRDGEPEQSHWRPRWHSRQRRHGAYQVRATGRPMTPGSSPGPTASTMPAPSWPITMGPGRFQWPSRTWRSEWQTPADVIRTRTSPGCGSSRRSVSIAGRLARRVDDRRRDLAHRAASRVRAPGRRVTPWCRCLAGVLQPRRDAVDGGAHDGPDRLGRRGALAGLLGPAQASQQLHLDGRQRVDVGRAQLGGPGERGVALQEPVTGP